MVVTILIQTFVHFVKQYKPQDTLALYDFHSCDFVETRVNGH